MTPLSQEETTSIFEDFLNEYGFWFKFKDYIENKGYELEELGLKDE